MYLFRNAFIPGSMFRINKFALLWGEAQLCLPYVCLQKKIAYSYPKLTYSYPKVTYSTLR